MRKTILDALFSKNKQKILTSCLLTPDSWWTLSDLARKLSLTPSSLQRDLKNLHTSGILEARSEQNRIYYKTNPLCPIISELQSILIKTSGIADVINSALKKHLGDIDLAFIYGSMARNDIKTTSDIDLMIIGDISLKDLAPQIREAERLLGREVNPTIYTKKEFAKKIEMQDAFLLTVLKDKKIILKGDLSEFDGMDKGRRSAKG